MSRAPGEAERSTPRQRVLVIDDEAVVGLSCRRALVSEGYEVQTHEDPQAGLQAALGGEFDVILVDLMMPGVSGLEVLKRVKAAGVGAEVVIITGHSTVESAVEAMKEGGSRLPEQAFLAQSTPDTPGAHFGTFRPDSRERRPAARAGDPPRVRGDHR